MDEQLAAEPEPDTSEPAAGEAEMAPGTWLVNADGTREPVPANKVEGLEKFRAAWGHQVEHPEALAFEGWQQADDEHPPGEGASAYRVVFKTIRTVTSPAVSFTTSNLRVRLDNGPITTGEPRFVGALAEREPGAFLQPEWGTVETNAGGERGYSMDTNMHIHIDNHEDTTPSGNYLEVIYTVPADTGTTFADTLVAGRAGVAPLLVSLQMQLGVRLLGPTLAEEVGHVFDDGHFNRRLGGRVIRLESQASMIQVSGEMTARFLGHTLERQVARTPEARRKVRIASQWYLRGKSEADATSKYIAFWLVLEALELDEGTNIAPLKRALADILDVAPDVIADRVGRLFGTRSKLVHGKIHAAADADISAVEAMAASLLEKHLLQRVDLRARQELAAALIGAGKDPTQPTSS